ncbi:MAG: hypothetical protein AAGA76_05930 [Pseudomonadota bacterium]
MTVRKACIDHIYNTGVNLAWAQVFIQNKYSAPLIREKLNAAKAHANAAGFFLGHNEAIDLAIANLDRFGVGPHALDATEAALFNLQGQLTGHCCNIKC